MAGPGKDVIMGKVKLISRKDAKLDKSITLDELEANLGMMRQIYTEVKGADKFGELERYCVDIVKATGDVLADLDVPKQLFAMCYFACSWIASYETSADIAHEKVLQMTGVSEEEINQFVWDNIDLDEDELIAKFEEEFLGEKGE